MGRPQSLGETAQVAFRLPVELIERLDRHVGRMRLRTPGVNITRADAVRHLLSTALDDAEAADTKAGKRRR